jgi:hypothetical protein
MTFHYFSDVPSTPTPKTKKKKFEGNRNFQRSARSLWQLAPTTWEGARRTSSRNR